MQIVQINDHKRRLRWADPKFVNGEQRVEFALSDRLQIAPDGSTWEDVPEAARTAYKTVHLGNDHLVDPASGELAASGVGFYNWLLGMTAAQAGITTPETDIVFVAVAQRIENFLTTNDLWESA